MTKSPVGKADHSSANTLSQILLAVRGKAAAILAAGTEAVDPSEVQVRGRAGIAQLVLAKEDGTPELFYYDGNRSVGWTPLLQAALDQALTASSKPGGITRPPEVPKDNQISSVIEQGEAVRRRVVQAIESFKWEPETMAGYRLAILGDRDVASAGKARRDSDIAGIIRGIEEMPDAPMCLTALLPKLKEVSAAFAQSRPMPAGKPKAAVYSPEAMLEAMVVELLLNGLAGWSAAKASDLRNAAILRAIHPKRRGDSKTEKEGSGSGTGAAQAEAVAEAPKEETKA